MKHLSNLHTHSTYCDGQDSLDTMVQKAVELGFVSLGFSGHSFTPCDPSYCMLHDTTRTYISEVRRLKAAYADKLEIYLGIERDYYTDQAEYTNDYDYVIGSIHYLFKQRRCLAIDHKKEIQIDAINELYDGNWMGLMRDYYELFTKLPERTHPDIIGHFDVISKFNEGNCLFDEASPTYRNLALEAMESILKTNRLFEMNTGAIARKKRTTPYPAPFLLRFLYEHGGEIVINSDCHDCNMLDCHFDQAADIAKSCGFRYAKILQGGKFVDIAL